MSANDPIADMGLGVADDIVAQVVRSHIKIVLILIVLAFNLTRWRNCHKRTSVIAEHVYGRQ